MKYISTKIVEELPVNDFIRHGAGSERASTTGCALRHRQLRFRSNAGAALVKSQLEVELVDVILGEDMRGAEQNLAAVNNLELAQFAGLKLGGAGF